MKLRKKLAAAFVAGALLFAPTNAWPWLVQTGTTVDPFFSSVVLLLHLDGTNGSTTYTDSSLSNHTLSNSGTSALTTANFKFGSASIDIPSSTSGPTSVDSADWAFGSGDFTIEGWIRRTATITGVKTVISQWSSSASQWSWEVGFNGTAFGLFYSTTGSNNPFISGTYTPTLNTWEYYKITVASTAVSVCAAGTEIATGTLSGALFNSTQTLRVGNDGANSRGFPGQEDEIRITKGVARDPGVCTAPILPFPNH